MTTELEKQFFDTFGIEPKKIYLCPHCKTKLSGYTWVGDKQRFECLYSWGEHPYYMGKEVEEKAIIDYEYPQIIDIQYLELILIYSRINNLPICYDTVERFKEAILECFIEDSEDYKHQVQAIFEVER